MNIQHDHDSSDPDERTDPRCTGMPQGKRVGSMVQYRKGIPMTQFQRFDRTRFFAGRVLGADDLQAEQDYLRGKSRLHNRCLHGWGVVTGLGVSIEQGTTLHISPGLALDCAGNELVLPAPEQMLLSGVAGRHYVALEYVEVDVAPLPSMTGDLEFSRVRETVRVTLVSVNPGAEHSGMGPGSPGCGQSHPLCLATISPHGENWRVAPARRNLLRRR